MFFIRKNGYFKNCWLKGSSMASLQKKLKKNTLFIYFYIKIN